MTAAVAAAIGEGTLPGRLWLYANYHCNLTCAYCLTESGPKVARRELGRERALALAREAAELGFTALGLTGGEPFLLPYLPELLAELAGILPIVCLSNGTTFTRDRLERLRLLAELPAAIQVSLDRPEPNDNDVMRGPENFRKVVDATPKLVEQGVRVRIATTVASITDAERARLCELHRRLGVPDADRVIRPIVHRGRAVDNRLGVAVTPADLPPGADRHRRRGVLEPVRPDRPRRPARHRPAGHPDDHPAARPGSRPAAAGTGPAARCRHAAQNQVSVTGRARSGAREPHPPAPEALRASTPCRCGCRPGRAPHEEPIR